MNRRDGAIAALVASAVGHLWTYRLSELVGGPSPARALRLFAHFSRRTFRWLGLEVEVHGAPATDAPCLYLSNHRSYLDIPVLGAVLGAAFLSRADVAGWRLVGPTAKAIGAVFVDRDDPRARVRAARALARRLCTGSVVVFPEGTTNGEPLPADFQPGLFRLLHRLSPPIVPVTIRYSDRRAYWTDEVALSAHLRTRVLAGPPLRAAVHIGPRLAPDELADGEGLLRAAYRAVAAPIETCGELVEAGAPS